MKKKSELVSPNETTNQGRTPRLRFSDFASDKTWRREKLRALVKEVKDKNTVPNNTILTLSSEDGLVIQEEYFKKRVASKETSKYTLIQENDFVYNDRSTARSPYGTIKRLSQYAKGVVSPIYLVFRLKKEITPEFLDYYFESGSHEAEMSGIVDQGARFGRFNINADKFFSIDIFLPGTREQQRIAACLSSLDELIAAHTQKLNALKVHKKGLMQQLFPAEGETVPKLRLPEFRDAPEWQPLPIGKKVELLSGYPFDGEDISENPSGTILLRGVNITEGVIRHSQDIDRYYLGNVDKLEKYKVQNDDLVIGMDGSKVGKNSALVTTRDSGALLVQRVARLRLKDTSSVIQFIYQHINSNKFHSYVDKINTSSGIPHISAKQINEFQICFPGNDEQQKIAACLSSLDELITTQTQKLDALKAHKKGLMQQLFPSTNEVNG